MKKEQSTDNTMMWLSRVPDIPYNKRGKEYTSECICGGTIHAVRSTYNGHLQAACDKCKFMMFE